jgi:hypothetical protein
MKQEAIAQISSLESIKQFWNRVLNQLTQLATVICLEGFVESQNKKQEVFLGGKFPQIQEDCGEEIESWVTILQDLYANGYGPGRGEAKEPFHKEGLNHILPNFLYRILVILEPFYEKKLIDKDHVIASVIAALFHDFSTSKEDGWKETNTANELLFERDSGLYESVYEKQEAPTQGRNEAFSALVARTLMIRQSKNNVDYTKLFSIVQAMILNTIPMMDYTRQRQK